MTACATAYWATVVLLTKVRNEVLSVNSINTGTITPGKSPMFG